MTDAVLIAHDYTCTCGNCGKQAFPDSGTHDVIAGFGESGRAGCGATFVAITSDRAVMTTGVLDGLARLRPDLPIIDRLAPIEVRT